MLEGCRSLAGGLICSWMHHLVLRGYIAAKGCGVGGASRKRRMDVTGYPPTPLCNLSIDTGVVNGGWQLSALFFQVELVIPHFTASQQQDILCIHFLLIVFHICGAIFFTL